MKPFKEHALSDIIRALHTKNTDLGIIRNSFLSFKAEKEHMDASLIKLSSGDSNAEKTMNAKATKEWADFHKKLSRLEAEYEFRKLEFKVLEYEYQARYLQMKLDGGLINKQE